MAIVGLSLPLSALCSAAVLGIQGSLNVHLHLLLHLAVDVTPEWQPNNMNSQPLFHGQSPVTKKNMEQGLLVKKGFQKGTRKCNHGVFDCCQLSAKTQMSSPPYL
jgi:hypothetical protein